MIRSSLEKLNNNRTHIFTVQSACFARNVRSSKPAIKKVEQDYVVDEESNV